MRVDEHTFMARFLPVGHAALAMYAMYHGVNEHANERLSIKQIASRFGCSPTDVRRMLDLAEHMLGDVGNIQVSDHQAG